MDRLILEYFDRGDACRQRQGISAERRRDENLVFRLLEDRPLSDDGRQGIAAGDALSKGADVRNYVEVFLRPPEAEAETRHDLVEDEQGGVLTAEILHFRQEIILRLVEFDRLDDDGRDLVFMGAEEPLVIFDFVVMGLETIIPVDAWDASVLDRAGDTPFMPAMVMAADELFPPRVGPGDPHRGLGGFRARLEKPDHFRTGDDLGQEFGAFHFDRMGKREDGPGFQLSENGRLDFGMVVSEHTGPQPHREI